MKGKKSADSVCEPRQRAMCIALSGQANSNAPRSLIRDGCLVPRLLRFCEVLARKAATGSLSRQLESGPSLGTGSPRAWGSPKISSSTHVFRGQWSIPSYNLGSFVSARQCGSLVHH